MKVTLKLYASLGQYLPDGARQNEAAIDVEEDMTISALLSRYNVPREACHLVLLNGIFQPPSVRGQTMLSSGDALAVWPPVAGG
ncbi:MAG TPA: MoaD/ThiS family protein [Hyphomicrobiaceae bacterium]|nr:MoaD/ThiS family protein [Hyphomicrobiaceae bacterium]